jgi:multidrug efflux pump
VCKRVGGFLLKPWNERSRTQMQIAAEVQAKLAGIPGLQIFGSTCPRCPAPARACRSSS